MPGVFYYRKLQIKAGSVSVLISSEIQVSNEVSFSKFMNAESVAGAEMSYRCLDSFRILIKSSSRMRRTLAL